jgi:hypothetical protein
MKILKKSDFGKIRSALFSADGHLRLLIEIMEGRIEIDPTGSPAKNGAKEVRRVSREVQMARKLL